jgi:hypothetical protein
VIYRLKEGNSTKWLFFLRISFIAFLAVSLHEEPKNTTKIFSKIKPENLKKSQEKVGG